MDGAVDQEKLEAVRSSAAVARCHKELRRLCLMKRSAGEQVLEGSVDDPSLGIRILRV